MLPRRTPLSQAVEFLCGPLVPRKKCRALSSTTLLFVAGMVAAIMSFLAKYNSGW
jgi:hypothetical protein